MRDVTPSGGIGKERRGSQSPERSTPVIAAGDQQAPATTAETRAAFAEETRDARGARAAGEGAPTTGTGGTGRAGDLQGPAPLLPHEESDQLSSRMRHAVTEFVDHPRDAVEEADHVLEELASRFTDAVNRRRRTLRGSWQLADGAKSDTATSADTEQLRLALRDYRELTERLLHV
ncbi:hypothetical protein [Streptomyces sp. A012304]|uniref:hypothetical protein n=1 Tax=Streptomyces sp. A012304 TaxID=375446 RepID=UPI00222EFB91|nr:hypothetical protein [Streptomyces sp. A012304]GKQ34182.1 hypothetical protein ALMP_07330 [Streptomyces sp. A012304]